MNKMRKTQQQIQQSQSSGSFVPVIEPAAFPSTFPVALPVAFLDAFTVVVVEVVVPNTIGAGVIVIVGDGHCDAQSQVALGTGVAGGIGVVGGGVCETVVQLVVDVAAEVIVVAAVVVATHPVCPIFFAVY